MPLNSEARLLSNDFLAAGLLEEAPDRLQFLSVFPFYPIHGNSVTYNCTTVEPATPLGFCDPIPEHTKLPNEEPHSFQIIEMASHFEVSYKAQDAFSETNDQFRVQAKMAARQLLYRFSELFEIGDHDADPNTFDGLAKLASPSQVIDLDCNPLTIEQLDEAKGMVRGNDGQAGVIITNQFGYELIRKAHYDVGELPDTEVIEVPDPIRGTRLQQVTKFDGWIVYLNDKQPVRFCETVEGLSPSTNIWFAILGWNHLHGIMPDNLNESMFIERKTIKPDNSKEVGHLIWPAGIALACQPSLSGILDATGPPGGYGRR